MQYKLSTQEVADKLNISKSTLKMRIHRDKEGKLKKYYKKFGNIYLWKESYLKVG